MRNPIILLFLLFISFPAFTADNDITGRWKGYCEAFGYGRDLGTMEIIFSESGDGKMTIESDSISFQWSIQKDMLMIEFPPDKSDWEVVGWNFLWNDENEIKILLWNIFQSGEFVKVGN